MIKELIIDLRQIDNVLIYKVVQQDESFAGNDLIFKSECVNIYSNYWKAIEVCGQKILLHINGTSEEKNCLVWSESYNSVEKATEIRTKIEKCVSDFNEYIRKENEKETCGFSCGETYWYMNDGGLIFKGDWVNDRFDIFRYNSKNAFKTREEAERKLEILNCIYDNQIVFTEAQWKEAELLKVSLYANNETHALSTLPNYLCKRSIYYFKDEETARKVADFIGYDDFIKYL